VLPEAWELVEDGHATEADFRALTFEHAVSLWAGGNPSFFTGTTVEHEVSAELESSPLERPSLERPSLERTRSAG
jgi:hypothetical protein